MGLTIQKIEWIWGLGKKPVGSFCSGQLKNRYWGWHLQPPILEGGVDTDLKISIAALLVGLKLLDVFCIRGWSWGVRGQDLSCLQRVKAVNLQPQQDSDKITAVPNPRGGQERDAPLGGLVRSENPTPFLLTMEQKQIGFQTSPHTPVREKFKC